MKPSQQALHLLYQEVVQACNLLLTLASGGYSAQQVFRYYAPDHLTAMCEADNWHIKVRSTTQIGACSIIKVTLA